MSNSKLVNYTKISPNRTSGRNHKIDTITIHCVVGQCSVETLGNLFANPSRSASSNYGVGYDGRIGMYVEEKDRSWCSSSSSNDNRAVTIEVASDTYHPYAVKDAAYNSTIKLVADICKRNGIKKLLWFGGSGNNTTDKNRTLAYTPKDGEAVMTAHRWFANKACPGDYLYTRFDDIANKVNAILGASVDPTPDPKPAPIDWVKADVPVLKCGDSGNSVLALQWLLNNWASTLNKSAFYCGKADGEFGTKTQNGVKGFQKEYGLPQTGEVGATEWSYLVC